MGVIFSICLLITTTFLLGFYKPTSKELSHNFKRQPPATMLGSIKGRISPIDSLGR